MASANYSTQTYASTSTGAQVPVQIDWRDDVPGSITAQVIFNAGASGSVSLQYTLDNAADPTVTPTWTTLGSAITATGATVISFPVQFIRINVGSLSGGTLTLNVLQGAIIGDSTGAAGGGGGGVDTNVNLAQVAGATTATGHGTAAGALRVELPTDGTGVVGLNAGANLIGKVGIDQTTPGTTNAVVATGAAASGAALVGNPVLTAGSDGTDVRSLATDTSGNQIVVGPNAIGATATGNPVPVARYEVTPTVLTNGQRAELHTDSSQSLRIVLYTPNFNLPLGTQVTNAAIAPVANATILEVVGFNYVLGATNWEQQVGITALASTGVGVAAVENAGSSFTNITSNTTTAAIKSGKGTLHKIIINNPGTTETITVYDSLTATGTKIATIAAGAVPTSLWYDVFFSTGLTVVTAGTTAGDITVIWR